MCARTSSHRRRGRGRQQSGPATTRAAESAEPSERTARQHRAAAMVETGSRGLLPRSQQAAAPRPRVARRLDASTCPLGRNRRVGLASGSARSRRPACVPRVTASGVRSHRRDPARPPPDAYGTSARPHLVRASIGTTSSYGDGGDAEPPWPAQGDGRAAPFGDVRLWQRRPGDPTLPYANVTWGAWEGTSDAGC